jgi:D-alanyl-D-alanine dipeptidase
MKNRVPLILLRILAIWLLAVSAGTARAAGLPAGFVYIDDVIPDIVLEIRYYSEDNFTSQRVTGYERPAGILSEPAAAALQRVAAELKAFDLGLKIFDAYRPQRAVDDFVRWAQDPDEQRRKARYYPEVDKANLIRDGYIAERSGHSRGSTVDLTLVYPGPAGTGHGHRVGLFRSGILARQHGGDTGAARPSPAAARPDGEARVCATGAGMVAFHPPGRAVPGHIFRFSGPLTINQ